MKKLVLLFVLFLSASIAYTQESSIPEDYSTAQAASDFLYGSRKTITSTPEGGFWNDPETWIGEEVPADTDNVVIDGNVEISAWFSRTCNNITVNPEDTLTLGLSNGMNVYGDVINNGVIKKVDTKSNPEWFLFGNLENNGIIHSQKLIYRAEGDQTITTGPDARFDYVEMSDWDTDGGLIAGSDLYLINAGFIGDCKFILPEGNGYDLYLSGPWCHVYACTIIGNGNRLVMSDDAYLWNTILEDVQLCGTVEIRNEAFYNGNTTAVIMDTLQAWDTAEFYVEGNIENNGTIRDSPDGKSSLRIEFQGNLHNNNTIMNDRITFTGTSDQFISMSPDAQFIGVGFDNEDPSRNVIAASDLYMYDVALFCGFTDESTFELPVDSGYSLSLSGEGCSTYNIHLLANGNEVLLTDGARFDDDSYIDDGVLKGSVKIEGDDVYFTGESVVIADTLQDNGNYSDDLNVQCDLINQGVIRDLPDDNGNLRIHLTGDLINQGIIENDEINLEGETEDQTIMLNQDQTIRAECEFHAMIGTGGYQWYKDGISIQSAIIQYLKFDSLAVEDCGTYYCSTNQGDSRNIIVTSGAVEPSASLPDVTSESGETVEIPLTVNNMSDLQNMNVVINYDDTVCDMTNAILTAGILENENYSLQVDTETPGNIGITFTAQADLFSGSGIVGYLVCDVIGSTDDVSDLQFIQFDVNSEAYIANTTDGSITVPGVSAPFIAITPVSNDFGDVNVDSNSDEFSFTLENTGDQNGEGTVALSGDDADQFTITSGSGNFNLNAGQTKTIKVTFNPTTSGGKNAILVADGLDPCNDTQATLSGNGIVVGTPHLELTPAEHDFADILINNTSQEFSFNLENTGDGTATGDIYLSGDDDLEFVIISGGGNFSLQPGSTRKVNVTFSPEITGYKNATLSVEGDKSKNDVSAALSGYGNEAPVIDHTPQLKYVVNESFYVSTDATDQTEQLESVTLYYRKVGQTAYQNTEMSLILGSYKGTVPAEYATEDGVEYYISAIDNFGVESLSGSADDPHEINPASPYEIYLVEKRLLINDIQNIDRPFFDYTKPFYEAAENEALSFVDQVEYDYDNGTADELDMEGVARLTLSERVTKQALIDAIDISEYGAEGIKSLTFSKVVDAVIGGIAKMVKHVPLVGNSLCKGLSRLGIKIKKALYKLEIKFINGMYSHGGQLNRNQCRMIIKLTEKSLTDASSEIRDTALEELDEYSFNEGIFDTADDAIQDYVFLSALEYQTKDSQQQAVQNAVFHNFPADMFTEASVDATSTLNAMYDTNQEAKNAAHYMHTVSERASILILISSFVVIIGGILAAIPSGGTSLLASFVGFGALLLQLGSFVSTGSAISESAYAAMHVNGVIPYVYMNPSVNDAFGPGTMNTDEFVDIHTGNAQIESDNIVKNDSQNIKHLREIDSYYNRLRQMIEDGNEDWATIGIDSLDYYEEQLSQEDNLNISTFLAVADSARQVIYGYEDMLMDFINKSAARDIYSASINISALIYKNGYTDNEVVSNALGAVDSMKVVSENSEILYNAISTSLENASIPIPSSVGIGTINQTIANDVASVDVEIINYGSDHISGLRVFPYIPSENATIIGDTLYVIDLPANSTESVNFQFMSADSILVGSMVCESESIDVSYYILPPKSFTIDYTIETSSTGGSLNDSNIFIYPNPFDPLDENGTIRYSLAKDGNVTIKIYDIGGTLVRTVMNNEPQTALNEQSVIWDGRNDNGELVANGVYFYMVESSSGEKAIGKAAVVK